MDGRVGGLCCDPDLVPRGSRTPREAKFSPADWPSRGRTQPRAVQMRVGVSVVLAVGVWLHEHQHSVGAQAVSSARMRAAGSGRALEDGHFGNERDAGKAGALGVDERGRGSCSYRIVSKTPTS